MKPDFTAFTNKFEFKTRNPIWGVYTRWVDRWFKKEFKLQGYEFKNTPLTKLKND